jgi:hypothetical protein
MMKRVYQIVALLSVGHVAAVVGVLAFLVMTGRLTPDRVEAMAAAWRGDEPQTPEAASQPTTQVADDATPDGRSAAEALASLRLEQETIRHVVARELREIQDRNRLAEVIRLDVVRRREQLAKDREAFDAEREKLREESNRSGFTKELESLQAAKPAVRKTVLMSKKDADALLLLMEMETRSVKQVIEACKTEEEIAWMTRLLDRMHRLDDARADELAEDGSEPPQPEEPSP